MAAQPNSIDNCSNSKSAAVSTPAPSRLAPQRANSDAWFTPAATGNQRIGPDISGFANLDSLTEVAVEFLRHPAEVREDSWQPSYAYLSDDDLLAVAAYVVAPKTDIEPESEETSDE